MSGEQIEDHDDKIASILEGKQPVISESALEVQPRGRGGNVYRS